MIFETTSIIKNVGNGIRRIALIFLRKLRNVIELYFIGFNDNLIHKGTQRVDLGLLKMPTWAKLSKEKLFQAVFGKKIRKNRKFVRKVDKISLKCTEGCQNSSPVRFECNLLYPALSAYQKGKNITKIFHNYLTSFKCKFAAKHDGLFPGITLNTMKRFWYRSQIIQIF